MTTDMRPRRPARVSSWSCAHAPHRQRGQSQRTTKSALEELLYMSLTAAGLHHGCVREHLYVPGRRYRADLAWPERRLLVEVQGGIWSPKSGHSGGAGITKDIERGNAATLAGWRVLRFAPAHIRNGEAVRVVRQALEASHDAQ